MADNARLASVVAAMGATGEGKSTGIRLALEAARPARLLVFDFKGEYSAFGRECVSDVDLYRRAVRARAGAFALVFRPSFDIETGRRQFDWFCRLAYELGDLVLVADELHRVMLPHWAPGGWNLLVSMGRARGVTVIAASQRPAGIEKSFWDQATVIRCGRLNGEASARAVAGVLMVPWGEVVSLAPLHYIQRNVREPFIVRGRIEWRRGRPRDVEISRLPLVLPGVSAASQ